MWPCREFEKIHLWKLWGEKSCRKAPAVIPHLRYIPCSEYPLKEWALENEEELVITWIAQSSALLLRLSHTSLQEGQVRAAHLLTRWGLINYLHKEIQCHGKDSKDSWKYTLKGPHLHPVPLNPCHSLAHHWGVYTSLLHMCCSLFSFNYKVGREFHYTHKVVPHLILCMPSCWEGKGRRVIEKSQLCPTLVPARGKRKLWAPPRN